MQNNKSSGHTMMIARWYVRASMKPHRLWLFLNCKQHQHGIFFVDTKNKFC